MHSVPPVGTSTGHFRSPVGGFSAAIHPIALAFRSGYVCAHDAIRPDNRPFRPVYLPICAPLFLLALRGLATVPSAKKEDYRF